MRTAPLLALALTAATALAGPLTPPMGSPAPTLKTLNEVQPSTPIKTLPGDFDARHVINQAGHYHLTGDLLVSGDAAAIRVDVSYVTIDLNGFRVRGFSDLDHAILGNGAYITVRNGWILNTEEQAIRLPGAACSIEDLTIVNGNSLGQVAVELGDGARVRDCTFRGGGSLMTGTGAVIERCALSFMRQSIDVGDASVIRDVSIEANGGNSGSPIVSLSNGCLVDGLRVTNAEYTGIIGGDACTIVNSSFSNPTIATLAPQRTVISLGNAAIVSRTTVSNWGVDGISIGSGRVHGCVVQVITGIAIQTTGSAIIDSCTIDIAGEGISAGIESLVENNAVASVGGTGIDLSFNSIARGNRLRDCTIGIRGSEDTLIVGNHLDNDPITLTSSDNVVDANVITDVTTNAIVAETSGNLIIRNRLGSTSTSAISAPAGNRVGNFSTTPASAGPFDNLGF